MGDYDAFLIWILNIALTMGAAPLAILCFTVLAALVLRMGDDPKE